MSIVKDLLKEGKTAVGTSAHTLELLPFLNDAGYDFILFDTQHSPVDIKELAPQMQAMIGKRATPIIRVGENNPALICYALDIGAKGIIIPLVNSKEEAIKAVRSCKYPPEGDRSNAGRGAGAWGPFKNQREYTSAANKGVLVLPQIETVEALNHIDEIVSVPGVDVALIGPSDLSFSMGILEDYFNPKYQEALDKIVKACNKSGVAPGAWFIPGDEDPNKFIAKGFRFFTLSWAQQAVPAIKNSLANIKR